MQYFPHPESRKNVIQILAKKGEFQGVALKS